MGCDGGYPIYAWQFMQNTGFAVQLAPHPLLTAPAASSLMLATPTRLAAV